MGIFFIQYFGVKRLHKLTWEEMIPLDHSNWPPKIEGTYLVIISIRAAKKQSPLLFVFSCVHAVMPRLPQRACKDHQLFSWSSLARHCPLVDLSGTAFWRALDWVAFIWLNESMSVKVFGAETNNFVFVLTRFRCGLVLTHGLFFQTVHTHIVILSAVTGIITGYSASSTLGQLKQGVMK